MIQALFADRIRLGPPVQRRRPAVTCPRTRQAHTGTGYHAPRRECCCLETWRRDSAQRSATRAAAAPHTATSTTRKRQWGAGQARDAARRLTVDEGLVCRRGVELRPCRH